MKERDAFLALADDDLILIIHIGRPAVVSPHSHREAVDVHVHPAVLVRKQLVVMCRAVQSLLRISIGREAPA